MKGLFVIIIINHCVLGLFVCCITSGENSQSRRAMLNQDLEPKPHSEQPPSLPTAAAAAALWGPLGLGGHR